LGWAGKDEGLTENLVRFLQDCELARFSPLIEAGRLDQDMERLRQLSASLLEGE
jgi:muramidase (phage lysozyme)